MAALRTDRRRHLARAGALAVVLAVALGGCRTGQPPTDPAADPTDPATPVAAELTVVVDRTGEGATTTWTLTCEPAGGDHPDPEGACAALAAAGGRAGLAPTPMNQACTEQWGGPQTASVTGTVDGERVTARFDRTNGCEISRWETLEPLFGNTGGGL